MKYLATLLIVWAVAFGAPEASAQPFPRQGGQQMQSLNAILANIRQQFPGQLSDVQGPVNGRYLVKWLTPDGQILFIDVDARSGQIIGVRGGGNFRRQSFEPMPTFRADPGPPRREGRWRDAPAFGRGFDRSEGRGR